MLSSFSCKGSRYPQPGYHFWNISSSKSNSTIHIYPNKNNSNLILSFCLCFVLLHFPQIGRDIPCLPIHRGKIRYDFVLTYKWVWPRIRSLPNYTPCRPSHIVSQYLQVSSCLFIKSLNKHIIKSSLPLWLQRPYDRFAITCTMVTSINVNMTGVAFRISFLFLSWFSRASGYQLQQTFNET